MKKSIVLLMLLSCIIADAQTKFSGVAINQQFSTFCTEMSKKYKRNPNHKIPEPNSQQMLCEFYLTFLDIENCHMNVWRKDGTSRVHELEIILPSDKSVYSYGEKGLKHYVIGLETFKHIFEIYKKKYGNNYTTYIKEATFWKDVMVEWKLTDVKILLQISQSKNNTEDEEYFSPKVFYIVEDNSPKHKTTIDDI